jgi:hypothetical protein
LSNAFDGCEKPRIVIGANTSGLTPSVVPSNPLGATPTIVIVCPLTMSGWFSTDGSRPNRFCQQV